MANASAAFTQGAPQRLAVLVSGRGSNLQAILDAIAQARLNAHVVGVFSNRVDAPALNRVAASLRWAATPNPSDPALFDEQLTEAVAATRPDWVVCAGYMRLLRQPFISRFSPHIINIHPSLLPKYKGLHTHARALAAGDQWHGASVHLVSAALDSGLVLAQASVPIARNDTPPTLANRVLEREHPLLLATLNLLALRRLRVTLDAAYLDNQRLLTPLQLESDGNLVDPQAGIVS